MDSEQNQQQNCSSKFKKGDLVSLHGKFGIIIEPSLKNRGQNSPTWKVYIQDEMKIHDFHRGAFNKLKEKKSRQQIEEMKMKNSTGGMLEGIPTGNAES